MNPQEDIRQDKQLDRAVKALRSADVPAGPPAESVQAALAAGNAAGPIETRKVRFTMKNISKIAAAILIVAGIAALMAFLTIGRGGATVAWADVQEIIRNAQTVTFTITIEMDGGQDIEMRAMGMEGRMRQELDYPQKIVKIADLREGKLLLLIESDKRAIYVDLDGLPEDDLQKDWLTRVRALIEESETELGEKEIDGQPTKGYLAEKDGFAITIWAHAETGKPVKMEMTMLSGSTRVVMTDFELDKELDESLFSMEPPEGYKVMEQTMDLKDSTLADVVELLRIWAKQRLGTFPDDLSPAGMIRDMKSPSQDLRKGGPGRLGQTIGRGLVFLQTHPDSQYRYLGGGVSLGDADKPVFWYKPEGSETCKVIYGDLRIEDVAEEDLPDSEPAVQPEPTPVGEDGTLELSGWQPYAEGDGTAEMIDDPNESGAKIFKLTVTGPDDVAAWRVPLTGLEVGAVYKISASGRGNGADCSFKVRLNVGESRMAMGMSTGAQWKPNSFTAPFQDTQATLLMELKGLKGDGPAEMLLKDLEVRKVEK